MFLPHFGITEKKNALGGGRGCSFPEWQLYLVRMSRRKVPQE